MCKDNLKYTASFSTSTGAAWPKSIKEINRIQAESELTILEVNAAKKNSGIGTQVKVDTGNVWTEPL